MSPSSVLCFFLALLGLASSQTLFVARVFPTTVNRSTLNGFVLFGPSIAQKGSVDAIINLAGAPANSVLAIHVHQFGDVSSPTGANAGSHFNPFNVSHGCAPNPRHTGDLGNITADANGRIQATITSELLSLSPDSSNYFLGRAIIIHETFDNCTPPVGFAGNRLGQGVIGLATGSTLPALAVASKGTVALEAFFLGAISNVSGVVTFGSNGNTVMAAVSLTQLTPNSFYTLNILESGDLRNVLLKPGPVFNPFYAQGDCASPRVGDLGSFQSSATGTFQGTLTLPLLSLTSNSAGTILGRSVLLSLGRLLCDQSNPNNGLVGITAGVIGVKSLPSSTDAPTVATTVLPTAPSSTPTSIRTSSPLTSTPFTTSSASHPNANVININFARFLVR